MAHPDAIILELRRRRETLGVSQTWLAQELGVSVPTISRWESGHVDPPLSRVRQLAQLLGARVTLMDGAVSAEKSAAWSALKEAFERVDEHGASLIAAQALLVAEPDAAWSYVKKS